MCRCHFAALRPTRRTLQASAEGFTEGHIAAQFTGLHHPSAFRAVASTLQRIDTAPNISLHQPAVATTCHLSVSRHLPRAERVANGTRVRLVAAADHRAGRAALPSPVSSKTQNRSGRCPRDCCSAGCRQGHCNGRFRDRLEIAACTLSCSSPNSRASLADSTNTSTGRRSARAAQWWRRPRFPALPPRSRRHNRAEAPMA